ncbi:hypothetical protein EU92_0448 [Prochlorococcus marinus str. MIT 9107]|uniref:Uncharacterized protein n=1 Tax=Prochlorococcus marinus str. MIT 9116 TaxID=167544 RepID=A0A0A1ZX30_PROMR|nr:hypothetical protein EU92_0448 [Prochlorococcus marinus str. MIT 9107]KGF93111.1 hypothetical protein EU93_0286 [Prochlorococcus marinus str. MIT 9116]KGF95068.1 hypothetical protein EU94_0366 [Prochlorococcus marinus str. MIT 9123]
MKKFLRKFINRHSFFIAFVSILFFLSTYLNSRNLVPSRNPNYQNISKSLSEISFINSFFFSVKEISLFGIAEVSILILTIVIIVYNRLYFINYYNKFSYYLKILLFSLLTFEELSFLTEDRFNFLDSFNNQNELNLHNSNFLSIYIFDFVPIFGKVGLITFLVTILLFIIGYGSFFKKLNKLNFIFLERRNSFYSNLYFLNLFLSNAIIYFSLTEFYGSLMQVNPGYIFNLELVEFFLYSLFLIDTIDKLKLVKK